MNQRNRNLRCESLSALAGLLGGGYIAVGLFLAVRAGPPSTPRPAPPTAVPASLTPEQALVIERQINQALAETRRLDHQAVIDYRAKVRRTIEEGSGRARNGIPSCVEELSSISGSIYLCYLMAKDNYYESTQSADHLGLVLNKHMTAQLTAAAGEIRSAQSRLRDQLEHNSLDLHKHLAALLGSAKIDSSAPLDLSDTAERIGQAAMIAEGAAFHQVLGAIGLAVDAIFVRQSLGQAQRLLGHIAARLSKTAIASLGSAFADGPSPLGDAIGVLISVGGLAMSAWDLYYARRQYAEELPSHLNGAIDSFAQQLTDSAIKDADALFRDIEKVNSEDCARLIQNLQK